MKTRSNLFRLLLFASLFIFASCEEDDPIIDPYADVTKYGNIVVTLSGNDPDGNSFSETVDYKYMPELDFRSSMTSPVFENDNGIVFRVMRKAGAIDPIGSNGYYADVSLYADNSGAELVFPSRQLSVSMNVFNEHDNSYFLIFGNFEPAAEEVTEYSYDPDTGKLKFKLTATLTEEENPSSFPNDLFLTAEVDVIVFKQIGDN